MDSLSQFELETNFILNPLLKELDMIYELETTYFGGVKLAMDGMAWNTKFYSLRKLWTN
jgi:hypothetical protein